MSRHQNPPKQHGPMGGGPAATRVAEKPKDFKGTFKKLLNYLGRYKITIAVVLVFAVASTVFMIVGPKILGNATTELFNGIMSQIAGDGTGINFNHIAEILLQLLGLYVLSALFSYLQGYLMTGVSMKVTYRLRNDIAQKINQMCIRDRYAALYMDVVVGIGYVVTLV